MSETTEGDVPEAALAAHPLVPPRILREQNRERAGLVNILLGD
ncbi:MAG TPA: hypothetical protein VGS27_10870 [Candidatus Sulfotelmatobacter sp.]|nr:hypothetical protein [Candidatus Sulfotelmatobacter sp.]